jgi:hypothetical protein
LYIHEKALTVILNTSFGFHIHSHNGTLPLKQLNNDGILITEALTVLMVIDGTLIT